MLILVSSGSNNLLLITYFITLIDYRVKLMLLLSGLVMLEADKKQYNINLSLITIITIITIIIVQHTHTHRQSHRSKEA